MLLTPDAYGGHGGIAQYNRDSLNALASMSEVEEIITLPRNVPFQPGPIPAKVTYLTAAAGGKIRYFWEALCTSKNHIDIMICGHINLLPLAAMLNIKMRAPLALVVHGIDVWRCHKSLLVRQLIGRVAKIWSVSEITRNAMQKWTSLPSSKFTILPNAINLTKYGIGPKNPKLIKRYGLQDKKVLLLLARLNASERYKGVDEVLEVLPNLLEKVPNLSFVVAGDGSDRPRLEQKARTLGISNHVIFTGFVPKSEKSDHFRLADLFVMPGRGEGFGIVFLEALACGVPVVASCLDGSREAVRNGELGRLVDPRNPAELEAAILAGLNDPHYIPEGLIYYSFPQFQQRVAAAIHEILGSC